MDHQATLLCCLLALFALAANMLQGMENSLRSGQLGGGAPAPSAFPNSFAASPAGGPQPSLTAGNRPVSTPAQAPSAPERQAPGQAHVGGDNATPTTAPVGSSKAKSAAPAPGAASSAAAPAPKSLEEEIRQEFALLMALGTLGANEAAAEALRRVRDRRGGAVKAGAAS